MLPPVILHLFLSPSGGPYRAPLCMGGPQRALLAWLTLLLWRWPALGATGALCVRRHTAAGFPGLGSLAFGCGWLLLTLSAGFRLGFRLDFGWISAWIWLRLDLA